MIESTYRNRFERCWLRLLDGRLNGYRHDGLMSVALAFKTAEEWQRLFASRGLRSVETRWLGPWWERLVHHPLLCVLDKAEGPGGVPADEGVGLKVRAREWAYSGSGRDR